MLRVLDTRAKRLLFCGLGLSGFAPLNDASARGLELLYSFSGQPDGALPNASLVADRTGNLYGTTNVGGVSNDGSVFKLSPDGSETVLYSFRGRKDGLGPNGGLIADKTGNLYGVTEGGGEPNYGTVFRLSPGGELKTLYAFKAGSDGAGPEGTLVADRKVNLYGATSGGGPYGLGTVFELSPHRTEKVLYTFTGAADGGLPEGSLIADSAGNLYGTAFTGGIGLCNGHGCGVVFKISPSGAETVLYSFAGGGDGGGPGAGLVADKNGNLYGPTAWGGGNGCNGQGCGTIIRLTPSGSETILYSFTGGNDGSHPWANVISDKKGNLFGTTEFGGADGTGVVFMQAPGGTETVLYDFMTGTNGREPIDGLMANGSGILFGTARMGGASNKGTVFELKE